MATGLYIDASGLKVGREQLQKLAEQIPGRVSDVLNASAEAIVTEAKRNAPADRGPLRQGISYTDSKPLQVTITSQAPYSAYVEFGTGKYAADYVAALPAEFQAFAATFKSSEGKRSVKGMLFILMDWFARHGIKDKQKQYFIAKKIVMMGTHAHPFLLPAYFNRQAKLKQDMETLLKKLK
jgi:HK97 gp10 family phage protein